MGLDAILNLTWLFLGLGVLVYIAGCTRIHLAILRSIGVGMIVVTLFPVISATDDIIRIQHIERLQHSKQQGSSSGERKHSSETLVRLYEAMESPLAASPVQVIFTAFFAFLIIPLCEAYGRTATIKPIGRAPPLALA